MSKFNYIVGGNKKFATLADATAYANHIGNTKNVILSIEEIKAPQKILGMGEFKTRVGDVFNMIKVCRMTHTASLDLIKEKLWNEADRKHGERRVYSNFMRGYVQGLIDAQRDDIERNHLEFCYLVDGVYFTTSKQDTGKRKTEEFYDGTGKARILSDSPNGSMWKGTDKIYYGFDK
jgi:hypothetical protein